MLEDSFSLKKGKTPAFWGYTSFTPEVLAFLHKIQLDYHLSNSAFAKLLGIHSTTLKKWFDGRISSCSPENYQSILSLRQGNFNAKLKELSQADLFLKRAQELYGEHSRFHYALLELFREFGTLYLKIRSISRAARSFLLVLRNFMNRPLANVLDNRDDSIVDQLLAGKEVSDSRTNDAPNSSSDLHLTWGQKLLQHRLYLHLSQSALADLLCVDWTSVRNWEKAESCTLRGENRMKIQLFLGGEVDSYMLNHYHYVMAQREVRDYLPVALRRLLDRARLLLQQMLLREKKDVFLLFQGLVQCRENLRKIVCSVTT